MNTPENKKFLYVYRKAGPCPREWVVYFEPKDIENSRDFAVSSKEGKEIRVNFMGNLQKVQVEKISEKEARCMAGLV